MRHIALLLRTTALRYLQAVESVRKRWQPDCGCDHPGKNLRCETCPCFPVFQSLVRDEIQTIIHQEKKAHVQTVEDPVP